MVSLVGSGLRVRPGEVSLAHLGILFLDELPEFQRSALDSLRRPLETGTVSVARANADFTFPRGDQLNLRSRYVYGMFQLTGSDWRSCVSVGICGTREGWPGAAARVFCRSFARIW
jgi:hypothetical protein